MKEKPKIGQVVKLNDNGMKTIGGLTSERMVKQAQRMTITFVQHVSFTSDVVTFPIEVDQPLINQFLISNHDIDLIRE